MNSWGLGAGRGLRSTSLLINTEVLVGERGEATFVSPSPNPLWVALETQVTRDPEAAERLEKGQGLDPHPYGPVSPSPPWAYTAINFTKFLAAGGPGCLLLSRCLCACV